MSWQQHEYVDRVERNHLDPDVEADFVDRLYTAAFDLLDGKAPRRGDAEMLEVLRAASQGSLRVALLARRRARRTADVNPADAIARGVHDLLTRLAASFIPEGSAAARNSYE